MVYVIVLTYQGPGKNFENNCYTLSFTVNCLNEKAYNLTIGQVNLTIGQALVNIGWCRY